MASHGCTVPLREFHKTSGNNQQRSKAGDIVLIHDDKPHIDWRLAVIKDLIPGGNALICAANVHTLTGKMRPRTIPLTPAAYLATVLRDAATRGKL